MIGLDNMYRKLIDFFRGMHGINYALVKNETDGIWEVWINDGVLHSFTDPQKALDEYLLFYRHLSIEL